MDASELITKWITTREGVCGGDACIRGTRIQVWLLYFMRSQGTADAELLKLYDLKPEALSAAWEYAGSHLDEVTAKINENQSA